MRKRNTQSHKLSRIILISLVGGFILLYSIFHIVRQFTQSIFFTKQDRINVVLYGQHTQFYSIGLVDGIDYEASYPADFHVTVPGGYGEYRVGALGKLVYLEHNIDILKRTIGLHAGTLIDFMLYPKSDTIYYGQDHGSPSLPSAIQILTMPSNASLIDRIYLVLMFSKRNINDFRTLSISMNDAAPGNIPLPSVFATKYEGYFYQRPLRVENKSIQILYNNSYNTALAINQVLEGTGVRVGDMSEDDTPPKGCVITEHTSDFSYTARVLAHYFECQLKTGPTDIYDILFELGDREKDWE